MEIIISANDQASEVMKRISDNTGKLQSSIQKVGIAFTAIGGATGIAAKGFIDAASEMEQQRVAFETLTGSVDTGRKTLEDLTNFAAQTPFEIPGILEQSKRLLAMGTSVEDLIPTFKALGDISSGVGMEKLPQLVLAFGQIQAKGRLMGTELRQLTEAGFNLADAMGVSNKELEEMVSNGDVSFEDVRQAMIGTTEEGGRFHNLMQEQADTTAGKVSNMNDNFFKLRAAMGEALLPAVNNLAEALLPLVQSLSNWAKENPVIVEALVAFGLALGVIGTMMMVLTPLIFAFAFGMGAVVAPIVLVGVAIAALIAIGVVLISHWDQVKAFAMQTWETIKTFISTKWNEIRTKILSTLVEIKNSVKEKFELIKSSVTEKLNMVKEKVSEILEEVKNYFRSKLDSAWSSVSSFGGRVIGVFDSIRNAIQGVINKIGELASKVGEGLGSIRGKLGFQHGGVIPGSYNQPVPAVLHGGERVIPRVGTDVNGGSGGGSGTVNIIIEGDVNSIDTLERIVEAVKSSIGRDNELAQYGVAI